MKHFFILASLFSTQALASYGDCINWGTKQMCGRKQVCQFACSASVGALGSILPGGAVMGATSSVLVDNVLNVCGTVCGVVDNCSDVPVCLQYDYSTKPVTEE